MKDQLNLFYEFDNFRVEVGERCLRRDEKVVPLTPKAFDTLLVLLENRGKIIEKDVFLNEVWTDTFVEEATLAQNISTLRKALGAFENDKTYIETVPRRGYRFIADVCEIVGEEEMIVVKRQQRMHIVAEQEEIHDSSENTQITKFSRKRLIFNQKLFVGLSALMAVILFSGIFIWHYFFQPKPFAESKFQKFSVAHIASSADIRQVTISPDGRYVALVEKKGDKQSLLLKQIANGNTLEIAALPNSEIIGAAFSRESDQIYYSVYSLAENASIIFGSLYQVPILGGASRQILKDIDSPAAVSPDGKQIAFIRNYLQEKKSALMLADINGVNERKLTSRNLSEGFAANGLAWSPDGRFISGAANSRENPEKPMELIVVDTASGEQKSLTPQNWTWIGKSEWLKDGSGIAVVAYGSKSPNLTDEIWIVSYPEGQARLITNGINRIYSISVSEDGNSMAAAKLNKIIGLYTAPIENLDQAQEISKNVAEESLLPLGADFTPNGKIVYSQTQNGNSDIWIINADGTEKKQLISDTSADFMPDVTPDGRFIVFLSNRAGSTSIWKMNIDGTNPKQISDRYNVLSPQLSTDGNWIYYTATGEHFKNYLWKVSINGGEPVKLTPKFAFSPKVSPDGKMIACLFHDTFNRAKLTLISAEDGKFLRQFDLPSENYPLFEWQKDSRALYVISDQSGKSSLWLQPIEEDQAVKLKDWQERIFRFAVSKDGEQIFWEVGDEVNSILVLKNLS